MACCVAMQGKGASPQATNHEAKTLSADSFDNFAYEKASEHTSEAARRHYWAVAIRLQDVDGRAVGLPMRRGNLDVRGKIRRTTRRSTR